MNLTFLNPLLLFGLAAAILPILIHRIAQKKTNLRNFSAVRLLLQSQLITAKPQRLKHLLLLALRIIAVMTLVFMMARPVLLWPEIPTLLKDGAKVLILDNSLSMGYREDGGQRFDIAKKAVREALAGFGGQVTLIPTVNVQGSPGFQWRKPEEALKELETIPLSSGRGNLATAFASAYQQLKSLKISKEIVVLSDLERSDWEGLEPKKPGIIPDADITVIRVGGPGRDANFSIKDVRLEDDAIVAGVLTRLEVTLSNLSSLSGTALVQINLSGTPVGQKSVNLTAGQDGRVSFDLFVEKPGWVDGEVRLSPDRLAADDVFYFPLKVQDRVKVLIVDGDPKTSLRASESYYLVSALRPGGSDGSPFLTRVIAESEIGRVDLRLYDTLFLLNVARPDFSRLASFLEMGRPVFLFLGDRIVPEAYNKFPLLSGKIREMINLGEKADKMGQIDTVQGIPKFLTPSANSLKSSSIKRYFKITGAANSLLCLGNRDPLLVATEAGRSRLFLFASSADLDWNDLPLNAAYLPLMQGLVKEALGLAGASLPAGIRMGETFREKGQPLQLRGAPGGTGIFQFHLPEGELRRGVNAPPEESDLVKVATDEVKKKLRTSNIKFVEYGQEGLAVGQEGRKELWPYLLGLLLVLLGVEMIYANRIKTFKR